MFYGNLHRKKIINDDSHDNKIKEYSIAATTENT